MVQNGLCYLVAKVKEKSGMPKINLRFHPLYPKKSTFVATFNILISNEKQDI